MVSTLLALPVERDATNYMGCTALFLAVEAKHEGIVQELLKSSASLNLKDLLGNSPLHLAVESGSESMTLLLLAHGADINE